MSNVSFSSQVHAASSLVSNDKLADVKWAGADSAVITVTYRNAFTAFFGRAVSWILDGGQNKALKENYFTDIKNRAEAAGIKYNPDFSLFNSLSSLVDAGSRKPLSAYVVKKVEKELGEALVSAQNKASCVQGIKDKTKAFQEALKVSQKALNEIEKDLNAGSQGLTGTNLMSAITKQDDEWKNSIKSKLPILTPEDRKKLEEFVDQKIKKDPNPSASPSKKKPETAINYYWKGVRDILKS
ncbi:hypothetical protein [Pseudochelatococcus sp. G4_1912]|uniref:hypothetical protein n=1 Tax=Pseudochelatococcus sp. G4_1912 TaxID=3114288 RepID=UPI0039C699F5